MNLHVGRVRAEQGGAPDARGGRREVQPLELGAGEVDPAGEKIRRDLDRALQELFRLPVVLGLHGDQREQPQRLDVLRVAREDLSIDPLGLLELAVAVALGRLGEQLACWIGAQERLHGCFGLVRATGVCERVHQRELRGLKLRVERDRLPQQPDGFVRAAQLQQRAAEFLVALGVLRQVDERAPQKRLGLRATALAVECGAEERGQVGFAREVGQRRAAELLGHRAVARAQEGERALERGAGLLQCVRCGVFHSRVGTSNLKPGDSKTTWDTAG